MPKTLSEDDVLRRMLKTPPKPHTTKKNERGAGKPTPRRRLVGQDAKDRSNTKKA